METKAQNIEKAQDNKQEAIKISSTMNKAVDLAIAELGNGSELGSSALEERILYWRTWLWKHWDDAQQPL